MIRTRLVTSLGTVLVIAGVASAQEPRDIEPRPHRQVHTHPWEVTPLVGTIVGADVSAGIQVETPPRVRVMATVGIMPIAYADLIGDMYGRIHPSREGIGDLLGDLTSLSLIATGNVTWRPFSRRGFFFGPGYAFQRASKDGLLASRIANETGLMLADEDGGAGLFNTTVRAHILTGTVGWEWGIGSGFLLRAALGVLVPARIDTELTPNFMPRHPAVTEAFSNAVSKKVEDAGTWIVVPSASLYLGYTFY